MVGITGVNIALPTATSVAADANKAEQQDARVSSVQVDTSGLRSGAERAKAKEQSADDSGEPGHIKQMREMIKKLQKQLAEEQKQLAQLMQRDMDETTKLTAITAKQASIATLSGQIMAATAELLEALEKLGRSSAGGMISTQA